MFPILKQQHSERIAIGYLAARIVDGVFIAVMVLFMLLQIPLAGEYIKAEASDTSYLQALSTMFEQVNLYAYHIAMFTLGIAGLLLCYTFYRAKLVPRLVAVWGLVGYATILCGALLEILGFNLLTIHAIPGGLWELFIGVWLIVKGFNPSAFASESADPDDGVLTGVHQPAIALQGLAPHSANEGRGIAAPALLLALMHPSAWKLRFSEVGSKGRLVAPCLWWRGISRCSH
jgi:Domain of unknown function (DUF4386)